MVAAGLELDNGFYELCGVKNIARKFMFFNLNMYFILPRFTFYLKIFHVFLSIIVVTRCFIFSVLSS